MLDQRSIRLVEELMNHEQITKLELMQQLKLSDRQLMYDFEKVNGILEDFNIPKLKINHQRFQISKEAREILREKLHSDRSIGQYNFSEDNRFYMIYLYVYIRKEPVSNFHLQSLFKVSKNTALSDVRRLKKHCQEKGLTFRYSRNEGYCIEGNEMEKRRSVISCIHQLLSQSMGEEFIIYILRAWDQENFLNRTNDVMQKWLAEHGVQLVKTRKIELIYYFTFFQAGEKGVLFFSENEKKLLENQSLFCLVSSLFKQLYGEDSSENEIYLITILLLTAIEHIQRVDNPGLLTLSEKIIEEFEKNTLLPVKNKQLLKESLFNHLVPAYFRILFEIPFHNPLSTTIQSEYAELFQFVKRSLSPLASWTKKEISDDEIGFFTMHFGSIIDRQNTMEIGRITGLIVCANGISSSMMLASQLKELFPEIYFSEVFNGDQFTDISVQNYDLVFSTIPVESPKPTFVVKPLMTLVEKKHLLQSVYRHFPNLSSQSKHLMIDEIMSVIKKNATVTNEEKLYGNLVQLFYATSNQKEVYKPMLSELLTEDMIQFTEEKLDWEEAIRKASIPLLDQHIIQESYVEAMIKNVKELGTYIHVGKGVGIPHARPENGVNKLGMSLLKLKQPIALLGKEDHQIDVFICLAAVDNEAHLKALAQLTKILGNKTLITRLKETKSIDEIISIIQEGEKVL
ncbi:transcription antiterminator [Oceanobacillus oncorhynchi]|uniref:transcription antiterminator n=1 Tax=Oceanobacillus oncorhynchi TaxID=545501 RepID=UPI0034D497CE